MCIFYPGKNLSTIVSVAVLSPKGSSTVAKSTMMWDQGWWGTGTGHTRLAGAQWEALLQALMEKAETNSLVSAYNSAHTKIPLRDKVL